jgi:DEAD/DEAH box helicase domain-containing protein
MYEHQAKSLYEAAVNDKNIVLTTGTGSGKTEGMYLPLFYFLLKEAESWTSPNKLRTDNWFLDETTFSTTKYFQRHNETREDAIRCLMLFPLNALVDDQKTRLRRYFSGKNGELLKKNLNENMIYFGSYTGQSGGTKNLKSSNFRKLKEYLLEGYDVSKNIIEEIESGNLHEDLRYMFPSFDGGEMWSNKDIQFKPPDILISNYTMLSIMLSRKFEKEMLDKTKTWLSKEGNKFTLIVDELHTYRGTQGTEIALMIRRFLDRIGAFDKPNKLRIISSSASMNEDNLNFLEDFFGMDKETFEIISDPPKNNSVNNIKKESVIEKIIEDNLEDIKTEEIDALLLNEFNRLSNNEDSVGDFSASSIANEIFNNAENSIELFSKIIPLLSNNNKFRFHNFIKTFDGLWACIDRNCSQLDEKYKSEDRLFGKLYTESITRCLCGSKVLKIVYCFDCGEPAFCGNVIEENSNVQKTKFSLTAKDVNKNKTYKTTKYIWPVKENSKEKIKDFKLYRYPHSIKKNEYQADFEVHKSIIKNSGELTYWVDGSALSFNSIIMDVFPKNQKTKDEWSDLLEKINYLPTVCPKCGSFNENNWLQNEKRISYFWEEFDKNKIRNTAPTIDALLRIYGKSFLDDLSNIDTKNKKVISFTDSVQGAADFAYRLEEEHYINSLRSTIIKQAQERINSNLDFSVDDVLRLIIEEDLENEDIDENFKDRINTFKIRYPNLNLEAYKFLQGEEELKDSTKQKVQNLINQKDVYLIDLAQGALEELLSKGMNPTKNYFKFYNDQASSEPLMETNEQNWHWSDSFKSFSGKVDWEDEEIKHFQSLVGWKNDIKREFFENFILNLTIQSDYEDLGLGVITFNEKVPDNDYEISNEEYRLLLEIFIRFLVRNYRWESRRKPKSTNSFLADPSAKKLKEFYELYFKENHNQIIDGKDLIENIETNLKNIGICKNFNSDSKRYILRANCMNGKFDSLISLRVANKNSEVRRCFCGRKYLQDNLNICFECLRKIENHSESEPENYFTRVAKSKSGISSLNVEELTGQTDNRTQVQQRFLDAFTLQSIPREEQLNNQRSKNRNPNKKIDKIDVLSVTTTMEAGVDMGALKMIWLNGAPPQRFNYQQRVGRTGRRGQKFSYSICGMTNNSHDLYFFENNNELTFGTPPNPFLSINEEQILIRSIFKNLLDNIEVDGRLSFDDNLDITPSTKGDFGYLKNWKNIYKKIRSEVKNNLIGYTKFLNKHDFSSEYVDELKEKILLQIEEINNRILLLEDIENSEDEISDVLTDWGYLPLYGMPGSDRHLILNPLADKDNLEFVGRDKGQALSFYSMQSEIRKDKYIRRSIGIANHSIGQNSYFSDPSNNSQSTYDISYCYQCGFVEEKQLDEDICNICLADISEGFIKAKVLDPSTYVADTRIGIQQLYRNRGGSTQNFYNFNDKSSISINEQDNYVTNYGFIEIHTINDNDRNLYNFQKIYKQDADYKEAKGNILIHNESEILEDFQSSKFYRSGWRPGNSLDGKFILGNKKITNSTLLQIKNSNQSLNLEFANYNSDSTQNNDLAFKFTNKVFSESRQAAWFSAGELIRKFITQELISCQANEIEYEIGYSTIDEIQQPTIYFNDTLANGSGFTKHFFDSDWIGGESNIREFINKKFNKNCCTDACYRCLKSYDNRFSHNKLNLQLGIDLVQHIYGDDITKNFQRYEDFLLPILIKEFEEEGFNPKEIENSFGEIILQLDIGDIEYFVTLIHPFETSDFRFRKLKRELCSNSQEKIIQPKQVIPLDYMEALRNPTYYLLEKINYILN